jgi:hypothetical protein
MIPNILACLRLAKPTKGWRSWTIRFCMMLASCVFPFFAEAQRVREAWVVRYNGPGNGSDIAHAITVDNQGNAYVTGGSEGISTDRDFATLKYATDSSLLWVARYNGPANSVDVALAILLDGQGSVYVAGDSYGGSGFDYDYAIVKYNSSGQLLWVRRYNGTGSREDRFSALAVDRQGNAYLTGSSFDSGVDWDFVTVKYDANGNQVWIRRYNRLGNSNDYARAIAVDGYGNVYVTGASTGSGTGYDYATVKYDANGNQVWIRRYNGPGNSDDFPRAIAVDGHGNVYVTGASTGSGTGYDYATVKYDANGNQVWIRRYNGLNNRDDNAHAIAVDSHGNVYVVGAADGGCTMVKYDSHGNELWIVRHQSLSPHQMMVDDDQGSVYVMGSSVGGSTVVRYDSNGSELWTVYRPQVEARALAIDAQGNVYVTGWARQYNSDYVTIKYEQLRTGDVNGDGCVDDSDLLQVLFAFGDTGSSLPEDLNRDGTVDDADLLEVLFNFGSGC